jgi:hypothetical protein
MYYLVETRTLFQNLVGRYVWKAYKKKVGSCVAGVRPRTSPINVNNYSLVLCAVEWYNFTLGKYIHGERVANITTDVTDTGRKYVDSAELSKWCASVLVVMNRTSS